VKVTLIAIVGRRRVPVDGRARERPCAAAPHGEGWFSSGRRGGAPRDRVDQAWRRGIGSPAPAWRLNDWGGSVLGDAHFGAFLPGLPAGLAVAAAAAQKLAFEHLR
jgi:hypothetical protein